MTNTPKDDLVKRLQVLEGSVETLNSECNQLNDKVCKQIALIDNLASMCRRLGYSVKRSGNDKLAHQCVELLKKYDLGGSIIRTHEAAEALSRREAATVVVPRELIHDLQRHAATGEPEWNIIEGQLLKLAAAQEKP